MPCAGDAEGSQAHAVTDRVFLGLTAWWEDRHAKENFPSDACEWEELGVWGEGSGA